MKLTQVQRDHFHKFMRSALDNNIFDELNYYLENLADWHFTEQDIEDGSVKEELFEECRLIRVIFDDE